LFERGDHPRLIGTDLVDRVEVMRIPNYRLHALKGDLKGYWSVTVKSNWRIVFRFENGKSTMSS